MVKNFYRMSTATTIENSGTGSNVLTKPAGVEVASIVPDKKYSVFIPSQATFITDFNTDEAGFAISLYAKPEPGVVVATDVHEVVYTGHSFYIENEVGDRFEIPERSRRAHHIVLTYNSMEAGLFVDGVGDSIPSDTRENFGPVTVTLLAAGGILEDVKGRTGIPSTYEVMQEVTDFFTAYGEQTDAAFMFDDRRDFTETVAVINSLTLAPAESRVISLDSIDCLSFKVEYELIGEAQVFVNDFQVTSGYSTTQVPESIAVYSEDGCEVRNLTLTYYYTTDIQASAGAELDSAFGSGTAAPTHLHDDNAANQFTSVVLDEEVLSVSGWFKVADGAPLPGVTMAAGVLTGTDLYVNGKPYSGAQIKDWYFLTVNSPAVREFDVDVPLHALHTSDTVLTATETDDLYESFFGNPKMTMPTESLLVTEHPAFIIATEWSIVSSG